MMSSQPFKTFTKLLYNGLDNVDNLNPHITFYSNRERVLFYLLFSFILQVSQIFDKELELQAL